MAFKRTYNKIRFFSSILLLAFYLVIGIMFLFTEVWIDLIPEGRAAIGLILIGFGSLRFYIAYRRFINKKMTLQTKKEEHKDAVAE